MLELLVNDYARKGFVDGRSARLPTVIVRPGAPNAAASSWVSGVFREPLAGEECVLPVGLDMRTPVGGVRTVVEGLIRLHDVEAARLEADRGVLFPSVSCTAGDMVECVRRVAARAAARSGRSPCSPIPRSSESAAAGPCMRTPAGQPPWAYRATRSSTRSSRPMSRTTSSRMVAAGPALGVERQAGSPLLEPQRERGDRAGIRDLSERGLRGEAFEDDVLVLVGHAVLRR